MDSARDIAVVLTVSNLWNNSGITDVVIHLANGLAARNIPVELICWDQVDQGVSLPSHPAVVVTSTGSVPYAVRMVAYFRAVSDAFARFRGCGYQPVHHDHGLWVPASLTAGISASQAGVPTVLSTHGMLSPWALAYKARKKRVAWLLYQRWLFRRAAALHVTAPMEADDVRACAPVGTIYTIPLGVERPPQLQTNRHRQAVFISRLHPKKGIDLLLHAWAKTRPSEWNLLIVGPDENDYRRELETLVNTLSLSSEVEIGDAVHGTAKWRLMDQSALFVLPSYSENFGIVVAEALASGLPVITTDATPWTNLAEQGCGWTVAPSVEGLTGALAIATSLSPEKLAAMGEAGRRWMVASYSWDSFVDHSLAMYRDVSMTHGKSL